MRSREGTALLSRSAAEAQWKGTIPSLRPYLSRQITQSDLNDRYSGLFSDVRLESFR